MLLSINTDSNDPAAPIFRGVEGVEDTPGVLFINPDEVVGISQAVGHHTYIQLRFSSTLLPCQCCPIKLKEYIEEHQAKVPLR